MDYRPKRGRHSIYLRIVALVDELAPCRRGLTTDELLERINTRIGENYERNTIRRDLLALLSVGYVERQKSRCGSSGFKADVWTLRLRNTETIQRVALKVLA